MVEERNAPWRKTELSAKFPGRPVLLDDVHVGISINALFISKWEGSWNLTKLLFLFLLKQQNQCALPWERKKIWTGPLERRGANPTSRSRCDFPRFRSSQFCTRWDHAKLQNNCHPTLTGVGEPFDSSMASKRRYYKLKSLDWPIKTTEYKIQKETRRWSLFICLQFL